ncbi:MAG: hypothetical protein WD851_13725 [Pirellulales bacterium]
MPAITTERISSRRRLGESAPRREVEETREFRLAHRIRERIHLRLRGRIHDLVVQVDAKQVTLNGRCATYYSKQLAQHAALGVLEDEHLENAIVVALPS